MPLSDRSVILADESQLLMFERRRGFLTIAILVMIGSAIVAGALRTQTINELLSPALFAVIPIVLFLGVPLALAIRNLCQRHKVILIPARGCIEERKGLFIARMVNRYPLSLFDAVEIKPMRASSSGATIIMSYDCSLHFKVDAPKSPLRLGGSTDLKSAMDNAIRIASDADLGLNDHTTGGAPRILTAEEVNAMKRDESAAIPWWRESTVAGSVLVNLVFAWGIIFAGWEIFPIMVLFWCEHVIVAFYIILLSLVNIPRDSGFKGRAMGAKIAGAILSVGIMIGFFALIFIWYGWFIFYLFGQEMTLTGASRWIPRIFANVYMVIDERNLWVGIAVPFISHGLSTVRNYFLPRGQNGRIAAWAGPEYKGNLILQVFLVPGALALKYLESPAGFLLILVLFKSIYDIKAQRRQRQLRDRKEMGSV